MAAGEPAGETGPHVGPPGKEQQEDGGTPWCLFTSAGRFRKHKKRGQAARRGGVGLLRKRVQASGLAWHQSGFLGPFTGSEHRCPYFFLNQRVPMGRLHAGTPLRVHSALVPPARTAAPTLPPSGGPHSSPGLAGRCTGSRGAGLWVLGRAGPVGNWGEGRGGKSWSRAEAMRGDEDEPPSTPSLSFPDVTKLSRGGTNSSYTPQGASTSGTWRGEASDPTTARQPWLL